MKKVYLAGQPNKYYNNWKEVFKDIKNLECYDWEIDSDQTSPETFFPDDLNAVKNADILVAAPGVAPSEATWVEIGYFYANNTNFPGEFCDSLIIIWDEKRNPQWSIDFIKKTGHFVSSIEEAVQKIKTLC